MGPGLESMLWDCVSAWSRERVFRKGGGRLGYWLERFVQRLPIPYWAFFGLASISFYVAGILLSVVTGDLERFLAERGWVLLGVWGFVNGSSILLALNLFDSSMETIRPLSTMADREFKELRVKLRQRVTHPAYWVIVAFWLLYTVYDVYVEDLAWWKLNTVYNEPHLFDIYGTAVQAWSGCLLGGTIMFIVAIGMNLVYWKLCSSPGFSEIALTPKGRASFQGFKSLITFNTVVAAAVSAIALGIFTEAFLYVPLIAVMLMFLPTAIAPHYPFHQLLSRIKETELESLENRIESVAKDSSEPSMRDLLLIQRLSARESRLRETRTWIVDSGIVTDLAMAILLELGVASLINMVMGG